MVEVQRDTKWSGRPSFFARVGFDLLDVPSRWMFQSLPCFVDCGLGVRDLHRVFFAMGFCTGTAVDVGHGSLFGDVVHLLLRLVDFGPCPFQTFTASGFPEQVNIGKASGFSQASLLGRHWVLYCALR